MIARQYTYRRGVAVYANQKALFCTSQGSGQLTSSIATLTQLKHSRNVVDVSHIINSFKALHLARVIIPIRYMKYAADVFVQQQHFEPLQELIALHKRNSSIDSALSLTHRELIDYILLKCASQSEVDSLYQIWKKSLADNYSPNLSAITTIMSKANLRDEAGIALFNNMHKLSENNLWSQSSYYFYNYYFTQHKQRYTGDKVKITDAKLNIHPLDSEVALVEAIASMPHNSKTKQSSPAAKLAHAWSASYTQLETHITTAFNASAAAAASPTIDPNFTSTGMLSLHVQRQALIDLLAYHMRQHDTKSAISLLSNYLSTASSTTIPSSTRPYYALLPLSSRHEAHASTKFSPSGQIPLKRVQLPHEQFIESLFVQVLNQMKFFSNSSIEKGNRAALLHRIDTVSSTANTLMELAKQHDINLSADFYAAHITAIPHNMPSAWKLTHKAITNLITSLPTSITANPVIFYAHISHLCNYLLPESIAFALEMLSARIDAAKPVLPCTYNILISAATQVLDDKQLLQLLQQAGVDEIVQIPRDPQRFVSHDISLYQILSEQNYFKSRFHSVLTPQLDTFSGDAGVLLASLFAYSRLNNSFACFMLLSKLQAMNVTVPRAAYTSILDAAITTPKPVDPPLQWYAFLQPAETSEFLVSSMARDNIGMCRRLLSGMVLLYRGSIVYYRTKGWPVEEMLSDAKSFMSGMLAKYNITPEHQLISALVSLFVHSGKAMSIDDILSIGSEYKVTPDISHFLPLVKHLLASEETLHEALNVLDELSSRGFKISTEIIDTVALGLVKSSYNAEIASVLQEFYSAYHIRPSARSLVEILEVYLVSGEVDLATALVQVVKSMYSDEERRDMVYQVPRRRMRVVGVLSDEKLKDKFREFGYELDQNS